MTDAASQYEQMPDAMKMLDPAIQRIKNQAASVKNSSQKQSDKATCWQSFELRRKRYQNQPAHQDINRHRPDTIPFLG